MTEMAFEWSSEYETGYNEIDTDHHELFEMGRRFQELTMAAEEDKTAICSLLNTMLEKISEHFEREEALLEQVNLGALISHKKVHQDLMHVISTWKGQYEKPEGDIDCRSLAVLIRDWVEYHIVDADLIDLGKTG